MIPDSIQDLKKCEVISLHIFVATRVSTSELYLTKIEGAKTYPLLTERDLRSRLGADLQRRRKKASCVRFDTITTVREILCQRHWCEIKGHMISSLYLI
jgi:hypothetical protein